MHPAHNCRRTVCHKQHRSGGLFWMLLGGAGLLAVTSCVDVSMPRHWAAEQDHKLPTVGTRRVSIKATGGDVQVRAAREGADTIEIHAFLRGGGHSKEDAQECLQALEIALPVSGGDDATQEITWAWKTPKKPHWAASIGFEIMLPVDLEVAVETDNGKIDVVGVVGDCDVKTVNGAVRVVAAKNHLSAKSTNGAVSVESPAEEVDVRSVNGRVEATLTGEHAIDGNVNTTNGSVELTLAPTADVEVHATTTNGRVKNKLSLKGIEKRGKTQLVGKLGRGAGKLDVRTTNGDIDLVPYAAERSGRED